MSDLTLPAKAVEGVQHEKHKGTHLWSTTRKAQKKLGRIIPVDFPHLESPGGHINRRLVGTVKADFHKAWVAACKRAGVPNRSEGG
jgi:hypothetical protein